MSIEMKDLIASGSHSELGISILKGTCIFEIIPTLHDKFNVYYKREHTVNAGEDIAGLMKGGFFTYTEACDYLIEVANFI